MQNVESLPNIRQLMSESVVLDNAFSVGASTFFSFPAILGSVYPYHFGVGIDGRIVTIDGILKQHGYRTAQINESNALLTPFFGYGKNVDYQNHFLNLAHVDMDRKLARTFLKGEDAKEARRLLRHAYLLAKLRRKFINTWLGMFGRRFVQLWRFLNLYLAKNNSQSFQERSKLYFAFRNEVLRFIGQQFETPQFLFIHTIVNHLPYFPPDGSSEFSSREADYLNYRAISGLVTRRTCRKLKNLHIESMRRTDELLGDIVEALRTSGRLDDSIVVLTADHGEEFMEEGYFGHLGESSSDVVLHVPLMFHWPKMLGPRTVAAPVSTIDILPTICDLLGFDMPRSSRGTSLKPLLLPAARDPNPEQEFWERPVFSEAWETEGVLDRTPGYDSYKRIFTVRKGKYRLKVTYERTNENALRQRFDLLDWINSQRLDLKGNRQTVDELTHALHEHIYVEGCFARQLRARVERKRIREALGRTRSRI
jgi:arylsulfatase A-like enzyme